MRDWLKAWLFDAEGRFYWRIIGVALGGYLVLAILVGLVWSFTPSGFDAKQEAQALAEQRQEKPVTGYTTTATLVKVAQTLLDKPGGYLHNDRLPPGLWLDNMRAWEFGVLVQVRDLARAMRKDFSRSQSQSREQIDLAEAEPRFSFNASSWMLPSSESQYRDGIGFLEAYLAKLADKQTPGAQFYARADNLNNWLGDVSTRLGSLSQRLSASVGQRRLNTSMAGEVGTEQAAEPMLEVEIKTPWLEIDDVFYEARGTTWALLHLLQAVEVDFETTLQKKNALISLRQIIRELEAAQQTVWSPVILNGTGFGVFANHSLVMANYISRANAAIIDLRELLAKG